jgi:hypothetical protein
LQACINGSEDRGGANASQSGHEQQLRQRAVHFAANKLKEGHKCDVFRLHNHKMPSPAH